VKARREVFGDRFVAFLLAEDIAFGDQTDSKRRRLFTAYGIDGSHVLAARREKDERETGESESGEPENGDQDGFAARISQ
jgi:hypothetical protein